MARVSRTGGMISRRASEGRTALFNFHNQGGVRAEYQGARSSGFSVNFFGKRAARDLYASLGGGIVKVRGTSISAVVTSTDEIKERMRSYLDGHFTGSALHGNNHRRVSNASVQSVFYNDISDKGQVASLIYSKFGYRGEGGFIDFLMLHIQGGTIRAKNGGWMRIPNLKEPQLLGARSGHFPFSNSDIFFAPSKDGNKLYQLRRSRGKHGPAKLLATLVKSLTFAPTMQGLEIIMADRGAAFERHFDAEWQRRGEG